MARFLNYTAIRRRSWLFLLACVIFAIVFWTNKPNVDVTINSAAVNKVTYKSKYLLDFPNFRLLLNSKPCLNKTLLIIVIHSAPTHRDSRDTIRKTWASLDNGLPKIKTVFMLAKTFNQTLQHRLEQESEEHEDIVQGNFVDSYRNLTYKHVMGLRWAVENCANAQFVMKMDDDIFVDIYQLVNLLPNRLTGLGRRFACYYQHQMPVVRDPVSKWYVSEKEYAADTFDDYCSGWAYVVNIETAALLCETASQLPYFWIDDVHITGTVARRAGVGIVRMNRYFALETDPLAQWVRSKSRTLWNKVFAPTWGDLKIMETAHLSAKQCYLEKCICCFAPSTQKPITLSTKLPPTGKSLIKLLHV